MTTGIILDGRPAVLVKTHACHEMFLSRWSSRHAASSVNNS